MGMSAAIILALAPFSAAASFAAELEPPVVLENDYVRVTEIFAGPGQQVTIDGPLPRVIVSATRSRLEGISANGDRFLIDYDPGQILWRDAATAQPARLVAGEAQLFVIELKHAVMAAGNQSAPLEPNHSTIVDPDQHHLVFENEHVRIIDGMAPPGARSAVHAHPPSVLVSLTKSRFRVTIEGRTRIFDFEPAMVRWSNHFSHQWEILSGEARVVMVEIKPAQGDPRFRRGAISVRPASSYDNKAGMMPHQAALHRRREVLRNVGYLGLRPATAGPPPTRARYDPEVFGQNRSRWLAASGQSTIVP